MTFDQSLDDVRVESMFFGEGYMKIERPWARLGIGILVTVIVVIVGFSWVAAIIPTWGSTSQEVALELPGDKLVPTPDILWNHAITIRAPAKAIYPWLIQMGDSRAAFYSITFIENLFCMTSGECRYVNADRIHEEWQNPVKGKQGIIMDFLVIHDYQPDQYVLATATDKMPLKWTWLWYIQPVNELTSRLIVRHRIDVPEEFPRQAFTWIMNMGYVMERAMMLGIRDRSEGHLPSSWEEPLGAAIWLLVFALGVVAAVDFVRYPSGYHALGVGLEAIIILFILTFIQPPMWVRGVLLLMVVSGIVVVYWRRSGRRLFLTRRST
ncbi:MAG TPA: hypothetical protein DEQ80_06675 [Anaerolinea thermolimosa]|uniref:SRPBCC family protein n=1 Tax=Anaerolinea thermolimosa TaxID=229919 RepID=A0A3D1JIS3_9CHLR|nr:hypothetical protein [Anaerolinea thermolimosa]